MPVALVLGVLVAWPMLDNVLLSFQHVNGDSSTGFAGASNYQALLSDDTFWRSVRVTLVFAVLSLAIEFAVGVGLAVVLARVLCGAGLLRTLLLIPTMLTPAVAALNFRTMLNFDYGVVNYVLEQVGLAKHAWVSESGVIPLLTLVGADVWRSTPFFALILCAGLLAVPAEVVEAAQLDGAGPLRTLLRIKVPILMPLILVTVLFRVIDLFRAFDIIYVLTQGGPGSSTEVVSMHIYTDMTVGNFTSYAATEATVLALLMLILSLGLLRVLRTQA